ncbi:hypothetical protein AB0J63_22725 [Streptosporangium canum]
MIGKKASGCGGDAVFTVRPEVFMVHADARPTVHGRALPVRRVRIDG